MRQNTEECTPDKLHFRDNKTEKEESRVFCNQKSFSIPFVEVFVIKRIRQIMEHVARESFRSEIKEREISLEQFGSQLPFHR